MAAEFNPGVLTNRGINLLAKWQSGRCTPEITRAVIGNGSYSASEATATRTALKSQKMSVPISRKEVQGNSTALVRFIFDNKNLTEGFRITEVGIYARDPDLGEILYSIAVTANADTADWLPAFNGTYPSTIAFSYQLSVANGTNLTITAGSGAYAPADDFNKAVERLELVEVQAAANELAVRILNQQVENLQEIVDEHHEAEMADIEALYGNTTGVTKQVTLTNTKQYPFNSTIDNPPTQSISPVRKTLNYTVQIESVTATGGLPGEISIKDKQLNGFKMSFDGSAKTVTVNYRVIGGMAK